MGDLRDAFDASVEACGLTERDRALAAAGRKVADRIDEATATGEGQEVTKALYLVPHMMNILREMHATPASRLAAGIKDEDAVDNKLAAVRSIRKRPAPTKKRPA